MMRRQEFGFIFQSYNLVPVLTAYENVEFPLRLLNIPPEKSREMVMDTLEKVGLKGLEKRFPSELSGGQQQRVSIARAIVKRPTLILADEPTANLDSANGELIIDLMKELNDKEKITFIFSTHDKLIMDHARRLIHIRDGLVKHEEFPKTIENGALKPENIQ